MVPFQWVVATPVAAKLTCWFFFSLPLNLGSHLLARPILSASVHLSLQHSYNWAQLF